MIAPSDLIERILPKKGLRSSESGFAHSMTGLRLKIRKWKRTTTE